MECRTSSNHAPGLCATSAIVTNGYVAVDVAAEPVAGAGGVVVVSSTAQRIYRAPGDRMGTPRSRRWSLTGISVGSSATRSPTRRSVPGGPSAAEPNAVDDPTLIGPDTLSGAPDQAMRS